MQSWSNYQWLFCGHCQPDSKIHIRTSLVAMWLRCHTPNQRTRSHMPQLKDVHAPT